MRNLIILGAGGHAKVLAETAMETGKYSKIAFLSDTYSSLNPSITLLGLPIIGKLDYSLNHFEDRNTDYFIGIGDCKIRMNWIKRLSTLGVSFPTLIHPSSWVSPSAVIGSGTIIAAHSVVQSDCLLGKGVIINTSSSVDHDSILGDGVHICPGVHLAGNVNIGSCSFIGIGSSVIQGKTIGENVLLGAGSVVTSDLSNDIKAFGNPAKAINT